MNALKDRIIAEKHQHLVNVYQQTTSHLEGNGGLNATEVIRNIHDLLQPIVSPRRPVHSPITPPALAAPAFVPLILPPPAINIDEPAVGIATGPTLLVGPEPAPAPAPGSPASSTGEVFFTPASTLSVLSSTPSPPTPPRRQPIAAPPASRPRRQPPPTTARVTKRKAAALPNPPTRTKYARKCKK